MKTSSHRTLPLIIAAAFLTLFLCGCSSQSGPGDATLRGVVTDDYTGEPLKGVTIRIGSGSAVTGENGSYLIVGPPLGRQTVSAFKSGHADYGKEIEIQAGSDYVHNIALLDLVPLANYPATIPCWQIADFGGTGQLLAEWNPADDPNLIFYRSTVPLASRIDPAPWTAPGWTAFYSFSTSHYPMLMALGANETTKPSQGDDNQRLRNFTYWQNTERFVSFGGYFKEGEIQIPSPGWIRAAHQNGVPILGTLFFNEDNKEQMSWILGKLSQPEINERLATQMARIAKEYGFDGYIINQETTNHVQPREVQGQVNNICATFIQNIHKAGIAQGYPVKITWYQVFSGDFTPNALLDPDTGRQNTDFVYLDHGWSDDFEYSTFTSTFSPFPLVDVEYGISIARAEKWYNQDWFDGSLQPDYIDHPPVARLDYIRDHLAPTRAGLFALHAITPDAADGDSQELLAIDKKRSDYMNTLANYAKSYTAITSAPFVTYFNTGQGDQYFKDGSVVLSKKWSDMGQQDILPTYRQNLAFAYDKAYYGGSSLEVTKSADLYKASIPIAAGTVFEIMYQFRSAAEDSSRKLVLTLDSGKTLEMPLLAAAALQWTSAKIDLSEQRGKRIMKISVACSSQMDLLIGKMFAGVPDLPQAVTNTGSSTKQTAAGYYSTIVWKAPGANYAYEIYDGETFVGRASHTAFVAFTSRPPVNLRVIPVSFSGKR
jgi:endo-beta-N-acetylglucosaminidase D